MKTIFILLVFCVVCFADIFAQAPLSFKYQMIARNADGAILNNQTLGIQISILKSSAVGSVVYSETFISVSGANGLINLEIGTGSPVNGSFDSINWASDQHFLKLEIDPSGGNNYYTMGTTQLLSVPYALFAERAGNLKDTSSTNEIQTLFSSNDTIYLTNGGFVKIPVGETGPQGPVGETGPQGIQGVPGPTGNNGTSVVLRGSVLVVEDLPVGTAAGDLFVVLTDGNGYVSDGIGGWANVGKIQGPTGATGPLGPTGNTGATGPQGLQGLAGIAGAAGSNGISILWQGTLTSAPTSPTLNMGYYNSTDKKSYIYNGTAWTIISQDGATGAIGPQGPAGTYSAGTGLSLNGSTINSVWTKNVNDIYANNTGFVGIGTSTPTSALHVNGSVRITDESEGLDKILTSDANGNATWKKPVLNSVSGSIGYLPKYSSKTDLDTSLLFQNGSRIGIGSKTPSGRMMIQADASSLESEPLFEIRDKGGKSVMVVYQDSVHFYVKDDGSKANSKGSFAVSGQSTNKTVTSNLFYLNPVNLLSGQNAGHRLSSATPFSGKYNTFIGFEAGYSDTAGSNNVFLGKSAGYSNNANNNVFLGFECGRFNTVGTNNAFMGFQAGTNNSTGSSNVFIGDNAGFLNTGGERNVFIGEKTGFSNLNGSYNAYIGFKSGFANSNGNYNTFMGYQAGLSNTSNDNTLIGYKAGSGSISGGGNVFIGSKAGMKSNNPVQNIYIGEFAGYKADGDYNVYVGFGAGGDSLVNGTMVNNGSRNSFYGYKAGYSNSSGSKNVFVGDSAGYKNENGSANVFLGNGAGRNAINSNNNVLIGENAGAGLNNGTNNILLGSYNYSLAMVDGNVSNQVRLGNGNISTFICKGATAITAGSPNMHVTNDGQIMKNTSSKRYKKDISNIEINTENIYKLRPVSYTSISDNQPYFGLIAEEVAEVLPELAEFAKEKDVIKGSTSEKLIPDAVKYTMLSVLLLKEVQKHQETIKLLMGKIQKLETENASLIKKTCEIDSMKAEIEKISTILRTSEK